ncbi:ribosome small subunit-dependent GTPase A [Saccharospirillum impatiens]|uniref:ribosome small subunit-dependent GTPase A n=1 Tax=Saccharospirillum impatiens TaxID=169438 RepID=UPI0004163E2E|nr:ribosome small subunit-dependent GTPase A [Saccharospirillum impatiens]
MNTPISLAELGWRPLFQQTLTVEQLESGLVARILGVDRDRLQLRGERSHWHEPLEKRWHEVPIDERPTVGDWVWLKPHVPGSLVVLTRQTLLQRVASGTEPKPQLLAANIDTLFIVSSCNADFNKARLERYLALALNAGAMPVMVLTKADLSDTADHYREAAQSLQANTPVVLVNALDDSAAELLKPWLATGQTVAILGSSGVGKTTLTNTLLGDGQFSTAGIREQDAKGRHTTTARQMVRLPNGGWIVDTPGMRELRLGDASEGVDQLFDDIVELARQCRFNDCQHQGDRGCALAAAVEQGSLDSARLGRFLKLRRETVNAQQTPWERKQRYRAFGKLVRQVKKDKSLKNR